MSREPTTIRSPPRFSEQEDDLLVSCVAPSPFLYDPQDGGYKNQGAKAARWAAISGVVRRDVDSCKRRWKDIKNNYFKIKRQHKVDRCNWSLYEKLRFLDPVYENHLTSGRRMVSPASVEDIEELPSDTRARTARSVATSSETFLHDQDSRSGMDLQPSTSGESSVRKRRFEEVSSDEEFSRERYRPPQGNDDVDLFMRSIALEIKKMPARKIAQAKVRILTIVNELQFGQLKMGER